MTKRDSEPVASPQATRPEKCESPYHRPTSIYCLDCLPGDAPLGALLLSNRTPTQADVDRAVEIQALLDARKPAAQPAAGTTPQAERPARGVCAAPWKEHKGQHAESTECANFRAVAPVETPQPAKLMVTRGGEIHEECPDCRGECSPYKPAVETRLTAEQLAQMFHEAYERLAPQFSYQTRKASAKPWAEVPENNRKLMTAVCVEILEAFRDKSEAPLLERIEQLMDAVSELNSFDVPKALVDERMANAGLREEIERLNKKWQVYEQEYILPQFQWAKECGIDLQQLVKDNPGKNCSQLFYAELRAKLAEQERTIKRQGNTINHWQTKFRAAEAEVAALRELLTRGEWIYGYAIVDENDQPGEQTFAGAENLDVVEKTLETIPKSFLRWEVKPLTRTEYEKALSAAPEPGK